MVEFYITNLDGKVYMYSQLLAGNQLMTVWNGSL